MTNAALSFYVWDAQRLLNSPSGLRKLPAGVSRLLLGFTGEQLAYLAKRKRKLYKFHKRAATLGIKLELLLGEPTWALAEHLPSLVTLLISVKKLKFDGVHLDIERDQLAPELRTKWDDGIVAAIAAARAVTSLPIGISVHFRELTDDFTARVLAAGLDEVVAMVYVSNPTRAAEIMAERMGPSGLRYSIAQSIEPGLDASESTYTLGKQQSIECWAAITNSLATVPNFGGVVVQALADYNAAH